MTQPTKMKITDKDYRKRFDNLPKEELKKIVEKGVTAGKTATSIQKRSESATIRHFRDKNTDISILMEHYKTGDQVQAIAKYMEDNEKFVTLFQNAQDNKEKADILSKYMSFQLRMHELMFGTKTKTMNLNVSVDSAKSMSEIYEECKEVNND